MEYIEGARIDDYCEARRLDPRAAETLSRRLSGHRLRAPAPRRPSRPEALEHPRHDRRRAQAFGLWHRQAFRPRHRTRTNTRAQRCAPSHPTTPRPNKCRRAGHDRLGRVLARRFAASTSCGARASSRAPSEACARQVASRAQWRNRRDESNDRSEGREPERANRPVRFCRYGVAEHRRDGAARRACAPLSFGRPIRRRRAEIFGRTARARAERLVYLSRRKVRPSSHGRHGRGGARPALARRRSRRRAMADERRAAGARPRRASFRGRAPTIERALDGHRAED